MQTTLTQCPFCSVQCKAEIRLEERTPQGSMSFVVQGAPNAASQGRLCVKGQNAHQHAQGRERLKQPLIRKNGELTPASWEEALSLIGERFKQTTTRYGANAIGVYGGGSLTNETAYMLGKFARVGIGTRYIDYNGRFCMSAAASAGVKTFGMDRGMTCRLSDIAAASCIILAGTNIAECQPTLMPYFLQAKEKGTKIIVIDPRHTATAALADIHLQIKPGTDSILAAMLMKIIVAEGLVDENFVAGRTEGYAELQVELAGLALPEMADRCGLELEQVQAAAIMYGSAPTGIIFTARGVEQQTDGHLAVRGLLNLVLATGKIGREGCGYGAVTGQGNGQGGREHGQKADQLPGYRSIENDADRAYIASVWGIQPEDLPRQGVSAYELLERMNTQEIRTLFIMGSNPVVSSPYADRVEEGLKKLDCLVVADMYLSETARMGDVVLPVTSYLENTGTMTNLEGRVLLREAVQPPPGEAWHDWMILRELARGLGKEHYFQYTSAEEIFEELRIASKGGTADYYGITYERLRQEGGIYWPCPAEDHPGTGMLFAQRFAHEHGKAVFAPFQIPQQTEFPDGEYPLTLTNGRVLAHYLTGVQTRRSPALAARQLHNFVEIHPQTARQYRIREGEWVEISSRRGSFTVRSKYSAAIRPDTIFVPMHWGGIQNVNKATNPALDPFCKMPGFKTAAVRIRTASLD